MHKVFYASGFLYHTTTQQILLQQFENSDSWSLFTGKNDSIDDPTQIFASVVKENLNIKLPTEKIFPIYDYLHDDHEYHYLVYAHIDESNEKFKPKKGVQYAWHNFKQLPKLSLSIQTRQDIVVGQRVINAFIRSLNPPVEQRTY